MPLRRARLPLRHVYEQYAIRCLERPGLNRSEKVGEPPRKHFGEIILAKTKEPTVSEPSSHVGLVSISSDSGPPVTRGGLGTVNFTSLRRTLSTLMVFVALGGLALWGHSNDWTLPKFSALRGSIPDTTDDWCGEHNVPESICIECRPELRPRGKPYGWCRQHGVHECPLEHPEIAQVAVKPDTLLTLKVRAKRALAIVKRPENNSKCKLHQRRIQFVSTEAVERAGIAIEPVWEAPMVESVVANGETSYDQTQVVRLSGRVPGAVWRVEKQLGDRVRQGDVLALLEAAEVGHAKSEFLQAFTQFNLRSKTLESLQSILASGAVPEARLREAETALSESRIRLRSARQSLVNLGLPIAPEDLKGLSDDRLAAHIQFLGLPKAFAEHLDPDRTTAALLPIRAPFDGVVVSRAVVVGEVVDTSKVLFVVADVSQMWLTLNIRLEDAKVVSLGQPVRFRPDGGKDEVSGLVAWISTEADPKTRALKVQAVLANCDGRLPASTFGAGRIILREEPRTVVVPNDAVQWDGNCHVVFVRDKDFLRDGAPKVFHTRTIRSGAKDERYTEVIAGVLPGELVVTKGSAALQGELLRNSLGAG
jgi:membrane fusion protein, heavy metal efflux system